MIDQSCSLKVLNPDKMKTDRNTASAWRWDSFSHYQQCSPSTNSLRAQSTGKEEAIREREDAVTTVITTLLFLLLQDPHKEPGSQTLHESNLKSGKCGQQTQHKDRLLNISPLITEGSLLVVIKIHKLATWVSVNTEIPASFIAAEFNHMYMLCFNLWHEPKD